MNLEQKIFITDCEGPISKNDNAFELSKHYIPSGDKFFALLSKYDDVLADIVKKPGYKPGDTLKLILPFLKANGVSDEKIKDYSSNHIFLVPGARETLQFVKSIMPPFMVSTSYEQYINSLCDLIGFPKENVYCTRVSLNKYEIDNKEKIELRKLGKEISSMPMIEIPKNATSVKDFSQRDQETLKRLDGIFWKEIPGMESGKILEEINPVGGYEKAEAVKDIVKKLKNDLSNVIYFGDSITDAAPFQLVRNNGGLTVSFNGNRYAIKEADIAVLSSNTTVTSILADVFNRKGKEYVIDLIEDWPKHVMDNVSPNLRYLLKIYPLKLHRIGIITDENGERLTIESNAFRKAVRGEAIGKLG